MHDIYKQFLFEKHRLVNETGPDPHAFETAFSLANLLGIRLTAGAEMASSEMIHFAQEQIRASKACPLPPGIFRSAC